MAIVDSNQTCGESRKGGGADDVVVEVMNAPSRSQQIGFMPVINEFFEDYFDWRVEPVRDESQLWIGVTHRCAKIPPQGWKLHISASVTSADEVLRRVLPVLRSEKTSFKIAASRRALSRLNDQLDGRNPSQIGKFITIYPCDEEQAVRLAIGLDDATRGLVGPAIPSDRPLAPGSLVHYRYGGFDGRVVQTSVGEITTAIAAPSGELIPDRRLPAYRPPDWATDPFIAAGVADDLPAPSPLIAERYLVVSTIHGSPRGAVHLAVDIVDPMSCVLKQARRGAAVGADGCDARDRLRHEAEVLARFGHDSRFPKVFDLVEQDGDLYLAMEDLGGSTLSDELAKYLERGCLAPEERVIDWGCQLCSILEVIHGAGWVYRDLKSTNVVVGSSDHLKLIDFELAHDCSSSAPAHGRGTAGYMSPQQRESQTPTAFDDIYSLGALLYFLSTGAEPSASPKPSALLERAPGRLNPELSWDLGDVIAGCLELDPQRRFPTAEAVRTALEAIPTRRHPPILIGSELLPYTEPEATEQARKQACRLADALMSAARPARDGMGLFWPSDRFAGAQVPCRDLNVGSAGAIIALAELVAEFQQPAHRDVLADGANWLATAPRLAVEPLPGLYVGESGVGAALLRTGQVLGDEMLVDAAVALGRLVATLPFGSPDLFNGTAGRVRFHLWLWDEIKQSEHLEHATQAGDELLAAAEHLEDGGIRWPIPMGYDAMSGKAYLGYAHGAAGIGDALLDLADVTGEERFLEAARRAGRWLDQLSVPVLADESGLNWPTEVSGKLGSVFWCHGATGIGRFFFHLAACDSTGHAAEIARRAALTVARAARWAGPTQCHGLAGNIEFLLDVFQTTREQTYLREARSLTSILDVFASERDGSLVWPSDRPTLFVPEYMGGYAGVATCQLRLADPEQRPHQLSRAGFRYRTSRPEKTERSRAV